MNSKNTVCPLLVCIFICVSLTSEAQILFRKSNQSPEAFARQYLPSGAVFCHKVIEGNFGDVKYGKNIVAFYRDSTDRTSAIIGFALFRLDDVGNYRIALFADSIQPSMQESSRILAIGFANADSVVGNEIIVTIGQDIRLFDDLGEHYTGIGEFDFTSVYDSKPVKIDRKFYLSRLLDFEGECCNNIAETKRKLKEMGF